MQAEERLVLLDHLLGAQAPGVDLLVRRHTHLVVELGAEVQRVAVGGHVEVEDGVLEVLRRGPDPPAQALQVLGQLILGALAGRVPGGGVGARARHHGVVVESDDPVVAGAQQLRPGDHVVDLPPVVVPRADVDDLALAGQALVRQVQPLLDPFHGPLLEQPVDRRRVGPSCLVLLGGLLHPVVPGVLDGLLGRRQLLGSVHLRVLPHEVALTPSAGLLDEGDEHLAEEIAVEQGHVHPVDGQGVEEFPEAHVGSVDVRDVEQLEQVSLLPLLPEPRPTQRWGLPECIPGVAAARRRPLPRSERATRAAEPR